MRNFLKAGIWIGFIGAGISLMILSEQPLNQVAAHAIMLSLLTTAVSAFLYGIAKEDPNETDYVQHS